MRLIRTVLHRSRSANCAPVVNTSATEVMMIVFRLMVKERMIRMMLESSPVMSTMSMFCVFTAFCNL